MNYKEQFSGKKITIVGLGEHKEMLPEIKFLVKAGALVTLIDSRSKSELEKALGKTAENGVLCFGCDFSPTREDIRADIAIVAPDINPEHPWVKELAENGVRIETPQSLLFSCMPPVTLIGIMGTCGKSTVAALINDMLQKGFGSKDDTVHYISADGESVLALGKDIKKDHIIICKILPHQVKLYTTRRMVPQVSVITAYESAKTKTDIDEALKNLFSLLSLHTYNNFVVASDEIVDTIKTHSVHVAAKLLRTGAALVPAEWQLQTGHHHDRENIALASRTAELFKVSPDIVREVAETYVGLEGRLQLVKNVKGVEFYNDASSSTPLSTLTALKALSQNRNVVLIMGGTHKGEDMQGLIDHMMQYVSAVVLLPGSGTMRIHKILLEKTSVPLLHAESIVEAVKTARDNAGTFNRVLFSPGFSAGGIERSAQARGDAFIKAVNKLAASTTRRK